MISLPSNAEGNGGRDNGGKFAPGNKIGKGNPALKRIYALRTKMLQFATEGRHRNVLKSLYALAIGAEDERARMDAIKEWNTRTMGKSQELPLPPEMPDDQLDSASVSRDDLHKLLQGRAKQLGSDGAKV